MTNPSLIPQAPYSQEAEEAVLGAIMVNPSTLTSVASFLKSPDFYLLRHQRIWDAFLRLNDRGEPLDYLTVAEELKNMGFYDEVGGRAYLVQLMNNTPTSVYAEIYGRLVERAAIRRRLLEAAQQIQVLALDEEKNIETVISEAETTVFSIGQNQLRREFTPMWEALSAYYDRMEFMLQNQRASLGVPTGFRDLDQLLGGFQKSDLLIFAGRPGMGKCVAAGTLVATTRGYLPIERLLPANTIGVPDGEGGLYYPLEIEVQTPTGVQKTSHFYAGGIKPTLKITTQAGQVLTGTYHHPILIQHVDGRQQWKSLDSLSVGDEAVLYGNRISPIIWIEPAPLQPVYDLVVPEGHAFVANGIVSHNTAWMLTVAVNAARIGGRVGIFTMEMGVEQITQRIVAMESGIDMQKLRLAQLTPQEQARFVEVVGRISDYPIFIDDTPAMTPIEIRTKCRRLMHEHGLDLVFIDYMQLMSAGRGLENNRVQEISYISRSLKELARELNIPIISAAQLSRAVEQRNDKRPLLSDLRESGCIAGESLVYLPDTGEHIPIQDLVGKTDFRVLSINTETWKLEAATVTNAFCTGVKPVFKLTTALGRTIRATGNHKFLTIHGWQRLDELQLNEHIALPPETQTFREDVLWDALVSVVPDGKTKVYDLTVDQTHNFICNNIYIHNSIEQDADIVMFLYRDEVYNEATEFPNQADVIVAKHRNGPTGTISLYFEKRLTKFKDASTHHVDLSSLE